MINELTPEQNSMLPKYHDKWFEIGMNTDPINLEDATRAVNLMYECAGLSHPKTVIHLPSPLAVTKERKVGKSVYYEIISVSGSQIWKQINKEVWKHLHDHLVDPINSEILRQNRYHIIDQLWDQTGNFYTYNVFSGSHESKWFAFLEFLHDNFNLADKAKGLIETSKCAGWVWPFENMAIITDRPEVCHVENGLLHCDSGPAIIYRDGFSVFAFNGVRLPREWVEQKNTIDPLTILQVENADQRAAGLALIGWDRALKHLNHAVIEDTNNPAHGQLLEIHLPEVGSGYYLRALCPRNGWIVQGVDPSEMYDLTVHAAQAWCTGFPKHLQKQFYNYPTRRT